MKILFINQIECYLEVIELTKEEEEEILKCDGDIAEEYNVCEAFLAKRDFPVQAPGVTWLMSDDNFPVFNYGENIPFIAL